MTDQKADSVATPESSAIPEQKPVTNDKVAYETYQRVLAEAKKLKDKVKTYEESLQKQSEEKLREQNEWQKLAEQYKGKLEETSKALQEKDEAISNGIKYDAFRRNLGGDLKSDDFLDKIPFDKIVINPETKQIDEDSAKMAAAEFAKKYSYLVDFKQTSKMPNIAAKQTDFSSNDFNGLKTKNDIKNALASVLGKQQ
jgi:hypothetical protein